MASWDQYYRVVASAYEGGAFGDLDPMENAIIRLRAGVNEPRRDLDEVGVKLGVSGDWVGVVEQALLERLHGSRWWPRLVANCPPLLG